MAEKSDGKIWWIGGGFALFVIISWALTPWVLSNFLEITELNQRGLYGDMFGSINALFSGLAFVGVIVAILLQKEELEAQRNELEKTTEAFREQNRVLSIQQFENTFFQMVSLHNEIVNAMSIRMRYPSESKSYWIGREVFPEISTHLKEQWDGQQGKGDTKIIFTDICDKHHPSTLGHYYRNMFRIFRLIESSGVPNELFYSKIVHAQLSDKELVLLFYNCFFYERGKEFSRYAVKYKFFKNFTGSELLNVKHLDELKNYEKETKDSF